MILGSDGEIAMAAGAAGFVRGSGGTFGGMEDRRNLRLGGFQVNLITISKVVNATTSTERISQPASMLPLEEPVTAKVYILVE